MLPHLLTAALVSTAPALDSEELWRLWADERFVTTPAACLRHAELVESLRRLEGRHTGRLKLEEVGRSVQDRAIFLLSVGQGPRKVLLWSQMHGDEPSATPALLDLVHFLLSHSDKEAAQTIFNQLTLLIVPMLNPDGTELYERRNAQGIDVNRDALNLATPEGRILKRLRDRYQPILGFNLHDQNRRTVVGDTGVLATNSVLAVAGDPEGTLTPGRERAMRAAAAVVEALAPLVPGGVGRYDEDWSPRAFGDNLTAWGTPVLLIESGGLAPGLNMTDLTRLNFVALVTVLDGLARNDLVEYDPDVYRELPRNRSRAWADVAVRGGRLLQPGSSVPYRADLAFDVLNGDQNLSGCASGEPYGSSIVEVGDTRFLSAGLDIDATGSLIVAPFVVAVRGWPAWRWLSADTLERMAALGVAKVRWSVQPRRLAKAIAWADRVEGPGRTRLEPVVASFSRPWSVLTGPPSTPLSDNLTDVIDALAPKLRRLDLSAPPLVEMLGPLWEITPSPGVFLPGGRASFLVLSSEDPDSASLLEAWIDGKKAHAP